MLGAVGSVSGILLGITTGRTKQIISGMNCN